MVRQRLFVFALVVLAVAAPSRAAERLGTVELPNSGAPAAQAPFLRGLAALHSFWYDEAADAFREAQKIDPGFALAYWGEAMTHNHPIWQEVDLEAGRAILERLGADAMARAAKAPTERERGYLAAVETLYFGTGEKADRDRAYRAAMGQLAERFPEDDEAKAFHALAILGLIRAGDPADYAEQMRSAAILEEVFDRRPDHPGVLHYLIHAYDDPIHAPLGLRPARLYAETAPAAHHALHMPSHIFVQLGMWPRVAASNEDAWAASVAWTERRDHPVDKRDFHSLGWLGYAYLQQGRLAKAREVIETARQASGTGSERGKETLAELEARYAIETRQFPMPLPRIEMPAGHKGGEGGEHAAHGYAGIGGLMALQAAGLAAGLRGDAGAVESILAQLAERAKAGGRGAKGAEIMSKQVSGLLRKAKGETEEALRLLAEAADLEATQPAPSGPPGPAKPAQELYGEALLEAGKAKEAKEQFEKALARMPNRTLSLLGAARAAAALGDEVAARERYAAVAENLKDADEGLAEVAEAKAYLERGTAAGVAGARR